MGRPLENATHRHLLAVPADSADLLMDLRDLAVLVEQAELLDQLNLLLVSSDLAKRHFDSEKFASIFRQFVANVDHFGVHPKENPLTCLLWCCPKVNHREVKKSQIELPFDSHFSFRSDGCTSSKFRTLDGDLDLDSVVDHHDSNSEQTLPVLADVDHRDVVVPDFW
jgi:hypothetical protein